MGPEPNGKLKGHPGVLYPGRKYADTFFASNRYLEPTRPDYSVLYLVSVRQQAQPEVREFFKDKKIAVHFSMNYRFRGANNYAGIEISTHDDIKRLFSSWAAKDRKNHSRLEKKIGNSTFIFSAGIRAEDTAPATIDFEQISGENEIITESDIAKPLSIEIDDSSLLKWAMSTTKQIYKDAMIAEQNGIIIDISNMFFGTERVISFC